MFSKEGLDELVTILNNHDVKIYSTGGTQKYIENLGMVHPVEGITITLLS